MLKEIRQKLKSRDIPLACDINLVYFRNTLLCGYPEFPRINGYWVYCSLSFKLVLSDFQLKNYADHYVLNWQNKQDFSLYQIFSRDSKLVWGQVPF